MILSSSCVLAVPLLSSDIGHNKEAGFVSTSQDSSFRFVTFQAPGQSKASFSRLQALLPELQDNLLKIESVLGRRLSRDLEFVADSDISGQGFFLKTEPGRIRLHPHALSSSTLREIVYHEVFHWIHHQLRASAKNLNLEEAWIEEGLAQVFSEKVTGRRVGFVLEYATQNISTPLLADYDHHHLDPAWYGKTYLFHKHLLKVHSKNDEEFWSLFWKIAQKKKGIQGYIELIPQFEDFFVKAALAMVINKPRSVHDREFFIIPTTFSAKARPLTESTVLGVWNFLYLQSSYSEIQSWIQKSRLEAAKIKVYKLQSVHPYEFVECKGSACQDSAGSNSEHFLVLRLGR